MASSTCTGCFGPTSRVVDYGAKEVVFCDQLPFRSPDEEAFEHALTEHIDRNTWISMSVQRSVDTVQSRLQDGLAFLATVGSTAPFIGLFGTVWGIIDAFSALGLAGSASLRAVAPGISDALIATAVGLGAAIPAFRGVLSIVARKILFAANNPYLKPWKAVAYDLSLEKYFGTRSYISLAAFRKNLISYITYGISAVDMPDGVYPLGDKAITVRNGSPV